MELRTVHVGDLTEVHAAGRLDGHWSETLDSALNELIRQGRHRVRLRMAEVDYISSLGVRVLVTAHKRFRGVAGAFSVADVAGNVARVLDLAGLTALLMPPEAPAPVETIGPLRQIENEGLRLALYAEAGRGMRGSAFGSTAPLRGGGYAASNCVPLTVTAQTLSLGLGAFGDDFDQCRTRFGEYLAVAGAAVALPGDGSNTCDSLVSTGAFEPVVQTLYGLRYQGDFSTQVRFEPVEMDGDHATRRAAGSSGFSLSALIDAVLTAVGVDAACVVLLGESDGLIGA
ncbi:MAG: STAS domain-containing protein, partial [Pseudomonadales bacterium]